MPTGLLPSPVPDPPGDEAQPSTALSGKGASTSMHPPCLVHAPAPPHLPPWSRPLNVSEWVTEDRAPLIPVTPPTGWLNTLSLLCPARTTWMWMGALRANYQPGSCWAHPGAQGPAGQKVLPPRFPEFSEITGTLVQARSITSAIVNGVPLLGRKHCAGR